MNATERVTYEELVRDPDLFFRVQDEARRLRAREMWRMTRAVGRAVERTLGTAPDAPRKSHAPSLRAASCG